MFTSTQLKLSLRLFFKDLQTSLLNIAGLACGLACAIFIWIWVNDEISIDSFHKNNPRIYQVIKNSINGDSTIDTNESTPALMASMMKNEFPEVERAAPVFVPTTGILHYEQKPFRAAAYFTTADFFDIFSYPLLTPRPVNLLQAPNEVLISDRLAQTIFGTTSNVTGRTIGWRDEEPQLSQLYKIAGVFSAPPSNSTRHFDIVFSFDLYYNSLRERYGLDLWYSNNPHTFVLLKEGTNINAFNRKIKDYARQKMRQFHGEEFVRYEGDVFLQQYSARYLHNRYDNGKIAGGRIEYVRLFSIVGICILVLACINFMNLSTARASARIKEAGIRKIVGANRTSLIIQYLGESLFLSLLSLTVAIFLVQQFLPQFETITDKRITNIFTAETALVVLSITIITGLVAGSYPALLISAFKPSSMIKPANTPFRTQGNFRKALVVFQFSLSILFIISVMVVNKQMELIRKKNLGFNKNNIVRIEADGEMKRNINPFLNELKKLEGVEMVAAMDGDLVGNNGGGGGISWPGQLPGQQLEFDALDVTDQWISTMGISLAAGRSFDGTRPGDSATVIFNQTAIRMMNIADPVGKRVNMWGKERTIIGVVNDFHYESLYSRPGPFFLQLANETSSVLVKLQQGEEKNAMKHIASAYNNYTNGLVFNYHFLDEDFAKLYAAEERVAKLSGFFTIVATVISCLGLFGLVSFTVSKREKEIGIRKVVGARADQIAVLLSKHFIKLTLISLCIALPFSTVLMNNWLNNFPYRVKIGAGTYFVASGLILLVTIVTTSFHSIKASLANPAKTLKAE